MIDEQHWKVKLVTHNERNVGVRDSLYSLVTFKCIKWNFLFGMISPLG